ncbi:hypothetical protein HHX47_DHR6000166 [Lentinula edodes]|nr:hypothetical protein HHX47_DHR6000166 [Lentinula edodes]
MIIDNNRATMHLLSSGGTPTNARKLRPKFTRCTLVFLPVLATITTVTTTRGAVGALASLTDTSRALGTRSFFVGCGNNLIREVEPEQTFPEKLNAFGSQSVVVVLPRELGFHEAL